MNNLRDLRARQEILRGDIQRIRLKFQKQKEKVYGEAMMLRDTEIESKYYDEDVRLVAEIYKLTH